MSISRSVAIFGIAGLLVACAQQEETVVVTPQPTFDKFGGGQCEEGWIYIPGSVPELATCVPEDECRDPQINTATGEIFCPPPPPDRGDDDDGTPNGSTPTPRDPTGAAGTSATG